MRTQDIPCTFGGAAKHNVSNALAAAAAASVLGVEFQTIRAALSQFGDQPSDNPGRCQLVDVHGVKIMLDFGHNSHGLKAILDLGKSLIAKQTGARLCVSLGQAGDRLDSEILALGDTLSAMGTDRVILREMAGYERGREPTEVATMIRQQLIEQNYDSNNIDIVKGEVKALDNAFNWAKPGDLIMLLVHLEREAVSQWITDKKIKGGEPG
jgi:cyanophycin synthetase